MGILKFNSNIDYKFAKNYSLKSDLSGHNKSYYKELSNEIINYCLNNNDFVIGFNGDWGSGKSYFLENYIINNPVINKDNDKISFRYLSIWEKDWNSSAFEPIIYSLVELIFGDINKAPAKTNSLFLARKDFIIKTIKIIYELGSATSDVILPNLSKSIRLLKKAKSLYDKFLKKANEFDKLEKDSINSIEDLISNNGIFNEYIIKEKIIINLHNLFKKYIKEHPKKIIIIIDELDRCNPNFAIDVFEKIKHFFDIENLSFILSYDKNELEGIIKHYYGSQYNSHKYLNKFVNNEFILYNYYNESDFILDFFNVTYKDLTDRQKNNIWMLLKLSNMMNLSKRQILYTLNNNLQLFNLDHSLSFNDSNYKTFTLVFIIRLLLYITYNFQKDFYEALLFGSLIEVTDTYYRFLFYGKKIQFDILKIDGPWDIDILNAIEYIYISKNNNWDDLTRDFSTSNHHCFYDRDNFLDKYDKIIDLRTHIFKHTKNLTLYSEVTSAFHDICQYYESIRMFYTDVFYKKFGCDETKGILDYFSFILTSGKNKTN